MVVVVILVIIGSLIGKVMFRKGEIFDGTVTECVPLNAQFAEGAAIFSSAIKMDIGDEYLTFSTEDRQFATVKVGDHIQVKVFQYPSWEREKAGTWYGGRLLKTFKQ